MVKPDGMANVSRIIDEIYRAGFNITKLKMCHMSRTESADFCEGEKNKANYKYLLQIIEI